METLQRKTQNIDIENLRIELRNNNYTSLIQYVFKLFSGLNTKDSYNIAHKLNDFFDFIDILDIDFSYEVCQYIIIHSVLKDLFDIISLSDSKDIKYSGNQTFINWFNLYLEAIKEPNSTIDRNIELFIKKANGEDVIAELVEYNTGLVKKEAIKHTGKGLDFEDLAQEGFIGLLKAIEKFDYQKGYKFSTYAIWQIRESITRALENQGKAIRIPVYMNKIINQIKLIKEQLEQKYNRELSIEELSIETGISIDKLQEIFHAKELANIISLNTITDDDDEILNLIPDNSFEGENIEALEFFKNFLKKSGLCLKDQNILLYEYGFIDGIIHSKKETAEHFGISTSTLHRIESKIGLSKPNIVKPMAINNKEEQNLNLENQFLALFKLPEIIELINSLPLEDAQILLMLLDDNSFSQKKIGTILKVTVAEINKIMTKYLPLLYKKLNSLFGDTLINIEETKVIEYALKFKNNNKKDCK